MAKKKVSKKGSKNQRKRVAKQRLTTRGMFFRISVYLVITLGIYVLYCAASLPDTDKMVNSTRQPTTTVLANNGNEIQTFGSVYSDVIYLNELPPHAVDAIVSTEDHRFYSHFGFDIISFTRAMAKNIFARRFVQGGSTITQQVAKNLFLTSQKNVKRKVQELLLAFWLEYKFSKEQILTLYINRVYLGTGTYGIEAAANKYFQKSSRDLNLKEAAIIAGMLKAPSRYNPVASKERAVDRAKVVLNSMVDNRFITQAEMNKALLLPIGAEKVFKLDGGKYFADMVYGEVNEHIGERDADIYVLTTLDQRIQQTAEDTLRRVLEENLEKNVSQGAVVIMDYAGEIKALVGGVDYSKSQFNRAVQALRQPGSSFKTFVYMTALEQGYKIMDEIDDYPVTIGKWTPTNYDNKHYGRVTLLFALTKSLNLATVNLSESIGREKVIKLAQKVGITTKIKNTPSLALGTFEVKVIDMAAAYTAIANGGKAVKPYSIMEIYTNDGFQLYMREGSSKSRVLDKDKTKAMQEMLENVINNGTGRAARLSKSFIKREFAAGKTGTSQENRDAWFVGFTDKYVCAVWLGNDDFSPMKGVMGGNLPAEIWKKIMLKVSDYE